MNEHEIEILMIEDDWVDADLVMAEFRRNCLLNQVRFIGDGQDALDYLFCRGAHSSRNPAQLPVLILLDLNLPGVNGIEVLRQIRADSRTRGIPVIILTSSAKEKDLEESSKVGINGYLLKPLVFGQFADTIKRLTVSWLIVEALPLEVSEMRC